MTMGRMGSGLVSWVRLDWAGDGFGATIGWWWRERMRGRKVVRETGEMRQ